MLCSGSHSPPQYRTVILRVHIKGEKAYKKLADALRHMKGVDEYNVDLDEQKVTVSGHVELKKVMRKIEQKTGKKVEVWADENRSMRHVGRWSSFRNSFHRATHIFDDEDPNSCSIM